MKMFEGKKGQSELNLLKTAGIVLVVVAVTLGVGADILAEVGTSFTAGTNADYIIDNGSGAVLSLATWTPIIAIVVAAVAIISLLGMVSRVAE